MAAVVPTESIAAAATTTDDTTSTTATATTAVTATTTSSSNKDKVVKKGGDDTNSDDQESGWHQPDDPFRVEHWFPRLRQHTFETATLPLLHKEARLICRFRDLQRYTHLFFD
jgi:hypothetical protein